MQPANLVPSFLLQSLPRILTWDDEIKPDINRTRTISIIFVLDVCYCSHLIYSLVLWLHPPYWHRDRVNSPKIWVRWNTQLDFILWFYLHKIWQSMHNVVDNLLFCLITNCTAVGEENHLQALLRNPCIRVSCFLWWEYNLPSQV